MFLLHVRLCGAQQAKHLAQIQVRLQKGAVETLFCV